MQHIAEDLEAEGARSLSLPKKPKPTPKVPADPSSRACAQSIFTPFPNHDLCISSRRPQIPHVSWIGMQSLVLGLNEANRPSSLDLQAPCIGQVINYTPESVTSSGSFEKVSIPLAMFPASPTISFVLPYPGLPYKGCDTPNSSASCFIDGTRAAFDPCNVPQLYSKVCPWHIFHDNHVSRDWDESKCENLTPVHFFIWNQPGSPDRGGNWFLQRVGCAFSRREEEESTFVKLKEKADKMGHLLAENDLLKKFIDPEARIATYNMPFYDPLEWRDVLKWSTWGEGRDSLGYTLQYVAELKAMNQWLAFMIEWKQDPNNSLLYPVPNEDLMGAWASTIRSKDHWEMVMRSGAPIYIITRLPQVHPMFPRLVPGNLDGDERYRMNAFDAEHSLTPYWLSRHAYEHIPVPDFGLQCRAKYIPSILHPVVPQPLPPNAKSTSYLYTWQVPIYLDDKVERLGFSSLDSQRSQTEFRRSLDNLFPVMSPGYRILKAETDRHPLLDVLPKAWDNKLTRWEEIYDEGRDAYYPCRLGRHTAAARDRLENATFCWIYPQERIEILSTYPFPGRPESFGRVYDEDDDDDEDIGPLPHIDKTPRRYCTQGTAGGPGIYAFTWEPYVEFSWDDWQRIRTDIASMSAAKRQQSQRSCLKPSPGSQQIHIYDDPIREAVRERQRLDGSHAKPPTLPEHQPTLYTDYAKQLVSKEQRSDEDTQILQWRCRYVVLREKVDEEEGIPDEEIDVRTHDIQKSVNRLETQRQDLRIQIQRRLFKPMKGDAAIAKEVESWCIAEGGPTDICYPICMSGFHGSASNESIFAMLQELFDVYPHEVVIFSECLEVDSTRTLELGMRFAEDAIWIRAGLHGLEVDDRLLEVQFLHWMSGVACAISYPLVLPKAEQQTPSERLARIVSVNALPGLANHLATQAYSLEREMVNEFRRKGMLTDDKMNTIKVAHRKPKQNIIYSFSTLLTMDGREEFQRPVSVAQSFQLGLPDSFTPAFEHVSRAFAMRDGMCWEVKLRPHSRPDGARTETARKNDAKHKPIPKKYAEEQMSSVQCRNLQRAIKDRSEFLRHCWRPRSLHLPELILPETLETGVPAMLLFYGRLWDWQDACRDAVRRFCDEATNTDLDFSSAEITFGGLARTESLRGEYYVSCMAALQERMHTLDLAGADS